MTVATRSAAPAAPARPWTPSTVRPALQRAMDDGRWRPALRLADTALRLQPGDPELAADRLVCLVELGRLRRAVAAAEDLRRTAPERATTWNALAALALARGRWGEADAAARRALDADPGSADAWGHLAAAFAGLGWFDEADRCLAGADEAGGPKPLVEQRVGRATNRWALARSGTVVVAATSFVVLGLLAIAVTCTAPFVVRELRVRRLPAHVRRRAEAAWVHQHGVRVRAVLVVAVVALLWLLGLDARTG